MRLRNKRKWSKGELSRTLVLHCVRVLGLVLLWAVILAVVVWLVLRLVRRAQKAGKLPKVSRKGKPQAEAPAANAVEEKKNS